MIAGGCWADIEGMDIAALSTDISKAQLQTQVGVAVAKKALDVTQLQGDAAIALLESASQLQEQVARQTGVGTSVDVRG